jgi:general stress protein YciG
MGVDMARARGFALMTVEQRRKVSSLGGKAVHAADKAYKWDAASAREAGRKGGKKAQEAAKARRWTVEQARAAGIKGVAAKKTKRMLQPMNVG